jgi:Mitochondrial 39-S ribosomal protein L47 (MRP-L47)
LLVCDGIDVEESSNVLEKEDQRESFSRKRFCCYVCCFSLWPIPWSLFCCLVQNRYVLYKERNMLLTEQQLSRRKGIPFPQPQRLVKVRKGMGAIKQVLGERKREHLQRLLLLQQAGGHSRAQPVESDSTSE